VVVVVVVVVIVLAAAVVYLHDSQQRNITITIVNHSIIQIRSSKNIHLIVQRRKYQQ